MNTKKECENISNYQNLIIEIEWERNKDKGKENRKEEGNKENSERMLFEVKVHTLNLSSDFV